MGVATGPAFENPIMVELDVVVSVHFAPIADVFYIPSFALHPTFWHDIIITA